MGPESIRRVRYQRWFGSWLLESHRPACPCRYCRSLEGCGSLSAGFWCPSERGSTDWRVLWLNTVAGASYLARCGSGEGLLTGVLLLCGFLAALGTLTVWADLLFLLGG